jgi:hypothetical protein
MLSADGTPAVSLCGQQHKTLDIPEGYQHYDKYNEYHYKRRDRTI